MRCYMGKLLACFFVTSQVSLATRIQATRLPSGPSKVVEAPSGDATTTYFLDATKNAQYPTGVLTSIVDTFINGGTTTEYMTQHKGTHLNGMYVKIQTTSSREYYRINPTATRDYANSPVRPTGLIGSSTSVEIHGPASTFHTVEEYRTYIDGHYAHLVSSISNVVTDPGHITPTPIFRPAGLNSEHMSAEREIKKSLYSSYDFDIKPTKAYQYKHATRTIGQRYPLGTHEALELENEIESDLYNEISSNSLRVPRQNDLNDLKAVESDAFEVKVKPDRPEVISRPTYTVGENGELRFPTPSIEAIRPVAEVEPTQAHRFAAPVKPVKTSLDSVTYVGFVDFTTTIDDTVVIFRPKQTFNTETRSLVRPVIEATKTFQEIHPSSTITRQDSPRKHSGFETTPSTVPEIASSNVPEDERYSIDQENVIDTTGNEKESVKKHTSGIDALKSLLASSRRPKFGRSSSSITSQRSSNNVQPTRSFSSIVRPSRPASSPGIVSTAIPQAPQAPEVPELEPPTSEPAVNIAPSIDPTSDVELVFKTLYTTYTYFTTFFREQTTRVKSREEVISNVITLTNILKSSDLPSISSSCQLDSSCVFKSTDILDIDEFSEDFTGTVGRPNQRIVETPKSNEGRPISGDEIIKPTSLEDETNAVLKTFYTTYTYFSTLFVDGASTVSTRTEIYSNVQTASVGIDVIDSDSVSIIPTPSVIETKPSSKQLTQLTQSSHSVFPVRRLEISSVRPVQLHSELTTPATEDEESDSERPSTDRVPRVNVVTPTTTTTEERVEEEQDTTTEFISPTPILTTTEEDDEETFNIVTQETPALTEEVTEVITSATTESESEIEADATTEFIPRTLYTTFTYFTTLFKDGTSVVTSNLETVTNVMTGAFVEPTTVEPSVTFFTTFTYWTTSIDGDNTVTTSREETITDILPASVTENLNLFPSDLANKEDTTSIQVIESTIAPSTSPDLSVFTFYSTNYDGDKTVVETILSTASPSASAIPEIQSGEAPVEAISTSAIQTPDVSSTIEPTSSFQDEDNDLVLTVNEDEDDNEIDEGNQKDVKPTRSRIRGFTRPGNTFTPIIRPLLGRERKPNRIFRPSNRVSTTVATRTRNSVKPTLIATPASSAPQPTPTFGSSSPGFLASSSLFANRGQSRFSSSQVPGFSSVAGSTSISPTSVLSTRGGASATATISPPTEAPAVKISPIRLRRPNPFRARLKERQQQRILSLRNKNRLLTEETPTVSTETKEETSPIPIPNLPALPGGNAPIFVSSQRQTIAPSRRVPKGDNNIDNISVPDSIAARRERARERIKSLFSRRRPSFGRLNINNQNDGQQSRRKRQQLGEKLLSFFQ